MQIEINWQFVGFFAWLAKGLRFVKLLDVNITAQAVPAAPPAIIPAGQLPAGSLPPGMRPSGLILPPGAGR